MKAATTPLKQVSIYNEAPLSAENFGKARQVKRSASQETCLVECFDSSSAGEAPGYSSFL